MTSLILYKSKYILRINRMCLKDCEAKSEVRLFVEYSDITSLLAVELGDFRERNQCNSSVIVFLLKKI